MQFNSGSQRQIVKLLVNLVTCFVLISLMTSLAWANKNLGLPNGWESYLDRPDILSMKPQRLAITDENWEKLKAAHFSFIAFLLEAYPPETKIYFLARDSEHLYDVVRLITKGTKEADRFHLLNVSRTNMRDSNLLPYLRQNGISEQGLRNGEKILFVDTGFAGTIPRVISEAFPQDIQNTLKTHLLVSSNPNHPSSRSFLVHLNPMINESNTSQMHGTVISYEHMPRYTDRSSRYLLIGDAYHPISSINGSSDGSVSKEKSEAYMKDIIASWNNPQTRAQFQLERDQAQWFFQALQKGTDEARDLIKARLQHENKLTQKITEAQVRDFFESTKNTLITFKFSLEDLGLNTISESKSSFSKKNELIKKFPEWAPILENPDNKIPELFEQKNWQMIGNLIDANVDAEINKIINKNLFDSSATGIKKDLQILRIEKANSEALRALTTYTFSQPHTKDMVDLLKLIIEKADSSTLTNLAIYTFSEPHTKDMVDLLKLVIEKADSVALRALAQYTFSQSHTKDMVDLLKLVIEKADTETLRYLTQYTFSQSHTKDMVDLLKLIIEKADTETLNNLIQDTFSKPHTKDMVDLLKLVIEKADSVALRALAQYTFSQPHTKDMVDLLKLVIEKADSSTRLKLTQYSFSKAHTNEPKYDILRKANEISDSVTRKKFLDDNYVNQDILKDIVVKNTKSFAFIFDVQNLKQISAQLKDNDNVIIQNRQYKVIKEIASGRRGIVYQIQGTNGAYYALKIAKDSSAETLESLANESSKAKEWQSLGIPHSKVLFQASTYALKTWIPGITGEEVLNRYKAGETQYKHALEQLSRLIILIQSKGAYIGDFRPPNIIWTGKAWVIIDSGSINKNLNEDQVRSKWNSSDKRGPKFERRWGLPVPTSNKSAEHCKAMYL